MAASLLAPAVASLLKPQQQTKSLQEICLIFLSRNLHVEIITYKLFLLPHTYLTAIRDQLFSSRMNCQFTDIIFKCAFEKIYDSLPKWNWEDWCENVVTNSTKIIKCAVITCASQKVTNITCSKDFAITQAEADGTSQAIGASNILMHTSLTFEGHKYILSSRHPSMVFGSLLEDDSITEDGKNKLGSLDSSCIIASVEVTKQERMLMVAISKSNVCGSDASLIPSIISLQDMAEEVTFRCRYMAEYFAYINGLSPYEASSEFV